MDVADFTVKTAKMFGKGSNDNGYGLDITHDGYILVVGHQTNAECQEDSIMNCGLVLKVDYDISDASCYDGSMDEYDRDLIKDISDKEAEFYKAGT